MFLESSPDYPRSKTFTSFPRQFGVFLLSALAGILTACNGISTSPVSPVNPSPVANIRISLSPSTVTIQSGSTQQFVATLSGNSDTSVIWHTSAGTISRNGTLTAPAVTLSTKVIVTAVSAAERTSIATSEVTIVPLNKLAITIRSLAEGEVGVHYNTSLTATGGSAPYQWQITSGSLPQGLSLDKSSGVISGVSSQAGTFSFTTSVMDTTSATASQSLSLAMSPSTTGNFDGPAELPRVYVQSTLADTPAPGSVISVAQGGDFQSALDSASCGDTIQLQAGATFTGQFRFPAKGCDDNHWIIVRTSAPDSALPPEGTRLTPCYAGVASLPGRSSFHCTTTENVLAKILMKASAGSGPIQFDSGASHYRLMGLEITRQKGAPVVYDLASPFDGGTIDHIVYDRVWMHGTAQDETTRGIGLGASTYIAVVDSFFTDFHCISISGACGDAQAVSGGVSSNTMGPYQIVDNFLEASGENVMFGGGAATHVPTDIEIRRNHMFKPLIWMKGQPGYVGGVDGHPFIVKNLLELKNAQRVLVDGNILEYTWGGFSQAGAAVLLTPKNQASGNTNVCPVCAVTDVTLRYVTISHVGSGLVIGSGLSDNGGIPFASERYSIHDLIVDDIDAVTYSGHGNLAQIGMGLGCPTLNNIVIDHVTAFPPNVLLNLGDAVTNPKIDRFTFTNSIVNSGLPPFSSTGGGLANCAYPKPPINVLQACFAFYTFTENALIAPASKFPPSTFPAGNYFPASESAVEFVNYNQGNGGDYHLQSSSPYKNAGSDGKDLGADIDAVESAIAGVE